MKRLNELSQKYKPVYDAYGAMTFFFLGVIFDIFTLGRIDQTFNLIQQGSCLVILSGMQSWELIVEFKGLTIPRRLSLLWTYREFVFHFILGSLLSAFTLFYLKSSSALSSFVFVMIMASLLVLNEFESFKRYGHIVRITLNCFCSISYLLFVIPVFWGRIGLEPFLLSMILSVIIFFGLMLLQDYAFKLPRDFLWQRVGKPYVAVALTIFVLYFAHVIPPVPLHLRHIGIYHSVTKKDGQYTLEYLRPWYKFWKSDSQDFSFRTGDKVFVFTQVFSPANFKDSISTVWEFEGRKGWEKRDEVPINISGGREEGFRGFVYKSNFEPGDWRVSILASDRREIGRRTFLIESDNSLGTREFRQEVR